EEWAPLGRTEPLPVTGGDPYGSSVLDSDAQ
ncbi:MAG: hypothetical protein QOE59_4865, partial [Actinomycetota bacterium]|nr:hypothetical protein [Actinomycetota bacterium]